MYEVPPWPDYILRCMVQLLTQPQEFPDCNLQRSGRYLAFFVAVLLLHPSCLLIADVSLVSWTRLSSYPLLLRAPPPHPLPHKLTVGIGPKSRRFALRAMIGLMESYRVCVVHEKYYPRGVPIIFHSVAPSKVTVYPITVHMRGT